MELSVRQENLAKALSAVGRVATGRTELPILHNILLRTDGSRLLVAAMNMELASQQYIGAKITHPGGITVPARLVTDFVTSVPKGHMTLRVSNDHLHIEAGGYSSTINGVTADDFPELPSVDEAAAISYTLAPQDFKQAVQQTIITTSSDGTRPVLTGVYWHTEGDHLYLAGTDGYRLAQRRLVATTSQVAAIIPTSSLQEVLRTMTDSTAQVDVLFDGMQVRFTVDEAQITSQLVDGAFPPYQQLMPTEPGTHATLATDEFSRIVKVAGLFARDSGGSVTITLDEDAQTVSLHSVASELGENTSTTQAEVVGSGVVTLNSRYLAEALNVIDAPAVRFSFSGKLAPTLLTADTQDIDYKHIIMPLKS